MINYMNIIQIFQKFPTQESCVRHLEKMRWEDKPVCVYCGSTNTNPLRKELRHHCNGCRKSFSVTVGTIFHQTHIELQKWFLLISLMLMSMSIKSVPVICAKSNGMDLP